VPLFGSLPILSKFEKGPHNSFIVSFCARPAHPSYAPHFQAVDCWEPRAQCTTLIINDCYQFQQEERKSNYFLPYLQPSVPRLSSVKRLENWNSKPVSSFRFQKKNIFDENLFLRIACTLRDASAVCRNCLLIFVRCKELRLGNMTIPVEMRLLVADCTNE